MAYNSKLGRPGELLGDYTIRGSYRLVCSTGSVTGVAARTATAGFLFSQRWLTATAAVMFVKYVGARFTLTTAYGTAQETGCDLIIGRTATASCSGGTAVDVGSTVANTGNLLASQPTSLITANATRVATTDAFTAGTQTLDANPIGVISGWGGAIGDQIPVASAQSQAPFGTLFDARASRHDAPICLVTDETLIIRNLILMGATGVGRWDFCVEWDEGTPR